MQRLYSPIIRSEMDYDDLSTHEDSAASSTYSASTGNISQKIQWGQVVGSNNGTFTPTSTNDEYNDELYPTHRALSSTVTVEGFRMRAC